MAQLITGAQVLAKALRQQGVDVVFGIVGIPVVEVADAMQAEGIRFIAFRNEQSCSYAASAWGFLAQRPGVCLAVSGPGVVHALAGIVNSQVNAWPMVLIGGSCEASLEGAGAFQECRQVEMCRPHAKFAARPPSIAHIPSVVERAFTHALAGRPGAAYIDLPADLIQKAVDAAPLLALRPVSTAQPPVGQADPAAVARAAALLAAAKRPLLIVGKGSAYARAEAEIRLLVDKYQAPFLPTPMGKGVLPDSHPRNAASARSAALAGADVIVLLGARVNWLLHFGRRFSSDTKLIQIDVNSMQYPLDRLHYVMFQLLFLALVPSILAVSALSGKHVAVPQPIASPPDVEVPGPAAVARPVANPVDGIQASRHAHMEKCAEIERYFMHLATSPANASSPWIPLVSLTKPYSITVQGHVEKPFCFRVTFYAPAPPATAFDLLANVLRRPEWDELTESTNIVESLGYGDSIHYLKMKAVWPTAARDSVLVSRITTVRVEGQEDEAFLNVSQSIEDTRMPEKEAEGIVRMHAALAGQLVTRVPLADRERLGLAGDNWCKVVQIADGDLKGWIPKSVIKFIATQALPRSLTKVCSVLATTPPRHDSQLLHELRRLPTKHTTGHVVPVAANQTAPPEAAAASAVAVSARGLQAPTTSATVAAVATKAKGIRWSAVMRLLVRYATPA
ncbi:hypothetical protein EV174_003112, partial [Coemansia sp. RSA 2320]